MCGLILARGNRYREKLLAGIQQLSSRGFRSGFQEFHQGGIAHRRLPIVGVSSRYDQPVQRGEWTIAFVGEILNFRDYYPEAECDLEAVVDTLVSEIGRAHD